MNRISKEWHLAHKTCLPAGRQVPKNPTPEQRLNWHVEHRKNCSCREITGKLLEEMKRRGVLNED